ncbi:MAG: EthD family reductase [Chloroflexota bacterium]
MLKVVSMMKRKEGMSIDEFREWALGTHGVIGKRMPDIRHYRISVVTDDHADAPYDLVSELYFDDEAAFKAALESPVGAEAGADIKAHCADNRFRMFTEETIVIE